MTVYNADGSVYQLSTNQQFDPVGTEQDLFNLWDQEIIQIAGSPIYYYDLFLNLSDIDELYVEARNKVWSPCSICLYALYDPIPSQNFQGVFGIDSPNDEIMLEFNYRSVLKTLGKPPKIGGRIFTPHKRENWVIIQRNVQAFKLWGELRLQVMCRRFQETLTTGEGKVTQRQPDFKVNSIKDLKNKSMHLAGGQPDII